MLPRIKAWASYIAEVCKKSTFIKDFILIKKTEKNIKMNKQFPAFGDKVDESEICSKQYQLRLIGLLEGWKLGTWPIL